MYFVEEKENIEVLDKIDKRDIRNLLGKGWLTHDGMWFFHVYQELGIEKANKLNRAAIKSLAPIEVERAKRVLGIKKKRVDTFEEIMDFMLPALELTVPDSVFKMLHFGSPSKNVIEWNWQNGQCFAYKGMKQMGTIDQYHCGVMYRIECWLESLGVTHSIQPRIEGCLMHEKGQCEGEIRVSFQD